MLGQVMKGYLLLEEQGEGENSNRASPDNTSTGLCVCVCLFVQLPRKQIQSIRVLICESRHRVQSAVKSAL